VHPPVVRPTVVAMGHTVDAEGWYLDPFGIHQHRWFSAGLPTGLVRDEGTESRDPAPDSRFDGPLVRATNGAAGDGDGSDLKRAGDGQGGSYDPLKAFDAVLDGTTWFPMH